MDISVVIPSYNAQKLLTECLESVYKQQSNHSLEVIVVDNASSDDSVRIVEDQYPRVKLIQNEENLGFSRANNRGIRQSQGEFVLLLNQDTVVLPGAFDALVAFMQTHDDAGVVGCQLLNPDGSIQPSCHRFPALWRTISRTFFPAKWKKFMLWGHNYTREVDSVSGAAMCIRRAALDEVGPLDEDYFMYWEDVDLCYRMTKASWKVYFNPNAKVVHRMGEHWQVYNPRIILENRRSHLTFYKKNCGNAALLRLKVFTLVGLFLGELLLVLLLVLPHNREVTRCRIANVWRTMHMVYDFQ